MKTSTHTLEVSNETYDMLQQIKKIFVSYTGEDIESFSDDKIIEILSSWFLWSEDDGSEWCGEWCWCNHNHQDHEHKDGHECKGNCKC